MTRKDYKLIGDALKQAGESYFYQSDSLSNAYWETILCISEALQEDNERFNREKFIDYCKFWVK